MSDARTAIQHLVLHRLQKEASGPAYIGLAAAPVAINAAAQRLVEQVISAYSQRLGKGFGRFDEGESVAALPGLLQQLEVTKTLDFLRFSQQLMASLQVEAEQEDLASGGHVLVARVQHQGMDCLLVAILAEVIGVGATENGQVQDAIHLDLQQIKAAGRIDIGTWQAGGERYVSFLRGRNEASRYFKRFMGCSDSVTPLKETQRLVQGLAQFVEQEAVPTEQRDALYARAHEYLNELGQGGAALDLGHIAEEVWPDAADRLQRHLESDDIGLNGGFVPDRRAIKPLMRFKAQSPDWKLEFDRSSLRSGAVIYNKQNDTLVLFNVPEELRKALQAG